jgi:hypothetical protein
MVAPRLPRNRPITRSCFVTVRAFRAARGAVALARFVGLARPRLFVLAFVIGTSKVGDTIIAHLDPAQASYPRRSVQKRSPAAASFDSNAPSTAEVHRNMSKLVAHWPPCHLVLESHDGRALGPIPKRSTSPRATSTLQWRIV